MLTYTIRRILGMIPLMIFISIVIFTLAKLMPGDALTGMIDPRNTSPKYIGEMREELGLNDPIPLQYWHWIKGALQGDFGRSFIHKMPASEIIARRIPNTLLLAVTSLLLTYILAIILGMYAGKHPQSFGDRMIVMMSSITYAIPTFVVCIAVVFIFAIKLGWIPASGSIGIGINDGSFAYYLSKAKHTILPAFVLGLFSTAAYTQFLRNDIIENSRKDYVRTAMAKGTTMSRIYNKHIFRNSLLPLITFLGFDIGALLGGAVIVETVFTYP